MARLLVLLLGLAGQSLLGVAIARLILGCFPKRAENTSISFSEQAGLAIVLGIGLTAWILFVLSWIGVPLDRQTSVVVTGLGISLGLVSIAASIISSRRAIKAPVDDVAELPQERAFCRLCQLGIAFWIVMGLAQALMTPQRLWDERAIFAIKAAVLFEDKSIGSKDLADVDFVQGHPRYPLLLPLAEHHLYALLGEVDDRLSKVLFPLLFAGLVLTTVGVLSRHLPVSHAWMWGLLLATIPALMPHDYGFLCGQADAPIGCFHAVALLYIWDACEHARDGSLPTFLGSALVAGLCGGLAAFTKDEGLAFLIVDVALLGLLTLGALIARRSAARFAALTMVFSGCAIGLLLPWMMHRNTLPATTEMNYFGRLSLEMLTSRIGTLAWSVPHMLGRMFWEWREWGLHWWLMVAAIVIAPRRLLRPGQWMLLGDVLGSIAALLVAGMLAPVRLEEHIGGSSQRFLMQLAPVAILFAAGQLSNRSPIDGEVHGDTPVQEVTP